MPNFIIRKIFYLKNILPILLFTFMFFFAAGGDTLAQSPLRCGLNGEPCCNLAGSPPNSCQSGLLCTGGTCTPDPASTGTPPTRGGPSSGGTSSLTCEGEGINTAIGCIPVGDPKEFVGFLLRWAMSLGGLVALLLIVYSGFLIMTSSGNPKQVAAGKELLTAAISGLALLIMSAFLLNFIGVEILRLPNF